MEAADPGVFNGGKLWINLDEVVEVEFLLFSWMSDLCLTGKAPDIKLITVDYFLF